MRRVVPLFALLAGLLLMDQSPAALALVFEARLGGPAEVPPNSSRGLGHAFVTIDPVAHTMDVEVVFHDLIGTTTASHIHCCVAPPGVVGVATTVPVFPGFPLGVTSGTYSHLFDLTDLGTYNTTPVTGFVATHGGTVASAEAALVGGIEAGNAYFNIHSTFRPGGEIRGFLTRVPEPASLVLIGLGVVALVAARRRPSA